MSDDGSETAWGCLKTLEDVRSPWVRALGTFSVVVATLIGVPQAVKIIRRKSSIGVSFWTLALGNVGGFLYVLNMYVFHYDQIVLSGSPFVDFKRWASAQASLTFLWVELANTLSMLVVTPVARPTSTSWQVVCAREGTRACKAKKALMIKTYDFFQSA